MAVPVHTSFPPLPFLLPLLPLTRHVRTPATATLASYLAYLVTKASCNRGCGHRTGAHTAHCSHDSPTLHRTLASLPERAGISCVPQLLASVLLSYLKVQHCDSNAAQVQSLHDVRGQRGYKQVVDPLSADVLVAVLDTHFVVAVLSTIGQAPSSDTSARRPVVFGAIVFGWGLRCVQYSIAPLGKSIFAKCIALCVVVAENVCPICDRSDDGVGVTLASFL